MKKISLSLLFAMVAVFAASSLAAEKADHKKCVASAGGKKGADTKACNKLKKTEKKDCLKKADEDFKAAKAACAA